VYLLFLNVNLVGRVLATLICGYRSWNFWFANRDHLSL